MNIRLCGARSVCVVAGVFALSTGVCRRAGAAPKPDEWRVLKSTHFLVYYRGDERFSRRVVSRAESEYDRIAAGLGCRKRSNFWLWDKRVKIYVYETKEAFLRATGSPEWAAGKANYDRHTIVTFRGSEAFVNSVLSHELGHLIFRDFMGFSNHVPLWLEEGIAQWAESRPGEPRNQMRARLLARQSVSLDVLTRTDIRRSRELAEAGLFYTQAASVVDFLISKYGNRRFRKFCGHLRDGRSLDDALRFTYPGAMGNLEAMEESWRAYVLLNAQAPGSTVEKSQGGSR